MKKPPLAKIISDNVQSLMDAKPELSSQLKLAKKSGVGQRTIGRLLAMEGAVNTDTLESVACAFGVQAWELLRPKTDQLLVREDAAEYIVNKPVIQATPLISWDHIIDWACRDEAFDIALVEQWMPCPANCDPAWIFALRVPGDLMDNGIDGYKDGDIIFVDGSQIMPKHNSDYIIVQNHVAAFKRLNSGQSGEWYSRTINPNWPPNITQLEPNHEIIGKVIFSGEFR